jgi:ABC-type sugar transport system ATPase subunit
VTLTDVDAQNGASPMTPPLLDVRGATKTYGAVHALNSVSIRIEAGEILGLCGHNGAGKSTLMKVLTGQVQPDAGELHIQGELVDLRNPLQAQSKGLAIVDQELSLAPDLSVEENLFLGNIDMPLVRRRRPQRRRAVELMQRVGLRMDPRTLVRDLAIGERQLVEIARLIGRGSKILILDEPTATLSEQEIERVFSVVRELVRDGRCAIFVSHRLDEVLDLCNRVTVLRDGAVVDHRDTVDIADRGELIHMMIGDDVPTAPERDGRVTTDGHEVVISGLHVPGAVQDFSQTLRPGDVVGLTGQIGSGTTEVLRTLAGLVPTATGDVTIDGSAVRTRSPIDALKAGIAFASNDRKGEGLFLDTSIATNLVATRLPGHSRLGVLRRGALRRTAARLIDFVQLDARRSRDAVSQLSGGNQQKVFIGRCLERKDLRVLVLDEPTRGVDVSGRAEIHRLVREASRRGVAVIFASTELDEILDLADVVVTMYKGDVVAALPREQVTARQISAHTTMSRGQRDPIETAPVVTAQRGAA